MFNEKAVENYKGKDYPVWQMPKYKESRDKAIEIIEKYPSIQEGDFWILMRLNSKKDKMLYNGLIISHNGCLKLNDALPDELKFRPNSVSVEANGYNQSLVYTYCNDEQGIYEVGEASKENCTQAYPYAMAFKRLFDRVVLKTSKLAYAGLYSEVEADEFKNEYDYNPDEEANEAERKRFQMVCKKNNVDPVELLKKVGWQEDTKMTKGQYGLAMIELNKGA